VRDGGAEADGARIDGSAADACAAEACACVPDVRGFDPPDYAPTISVRGACSADEARDFGAACGDDPNAHGCADWLAAHATCARCLLGDTLPGPFRKSARQRLEISPGTCGQALAGERFDAGADAYVGGCGAALEAAGACVAYACQACTDALACEARAYRAECATVLPALAPCDRNDASACVLGSASDRARAIAWAVCGGSPDDAGTD
jgi:hypothetical protein